MTTLGVGVRVFIGWAPDRLVVPGSEVHRCQRGVIVSGVHPPGSLAFAVNGKLGKTARPFWGVRVDGTSREVYAAEELLSPIDDGDQAEPREQEAPAPRETVEV